MTHNNKEVISGDLSVTGDDRIEIELPKGTPHSVIVEFKEEHHKKHGCNPHVDSCEWAVIKKHHRFYLLICWKVSRERDIVWVVAY